MTAATLTLFLLWPAGARARAERQEQPDVRAAAAGPVDEAHSNGRKLPPPKASLSKDGPEGRKLDREAGGRLGGYLQTLAALALVVALIFLARFLIRRFGQSAKAPARDGPIEVLARTTIALKQQLLLVRLGTRLVLVGSAAGGLSALCEVTDAEEVDQLLKAVETARRRGLGGIFTRKSDESAGAGDRSSEDGHGGAGQAMGDLAEKMRGRLANGKEEQ